MPVTGRKPKPPGQAVNAHKPVHDWIEIPNVPFTGGPKLPPRRWHGQMWTREIRKKWAAWISMPHCSLWGTAEWEFALDAIQLAAQVQEGQFQLAAELRQREKVMGTTWDFRRDLRIRYVEPSSKPVAEESDAQVRNIADYRDA